MVNSIHAYIESACVFNSRVNELMTTNCSLAHNRFHDFLSSLTVVVIPVVVPVGVRCHLCWKQLEWLLFSPPFYVATVTQFVSAVVVTVTQRTDIFDVFSFHSIRRALETVNVSFYQRAEGHYVAEVARISVTSPLALCAVCLTYFFFNHSRAYMA